MSLILPFDDWPTVDQEMWSSMLRKGGPFDDHGALAHLREISRETLVTRYGRWLKWLRRTMPGALLEPPTTRVTLDRLRAWLAALEHTAPMSRLMFIDGVLRVVRAAQPEADWSRHDRLLAHLKHGARRGDPARKRGRILSSRVLLDAGLRLAGPMADQAATPLERALKQRDGAIVAILAMMPLRLRALSHLKIGTSLCISSDSISVILSEDMTKTGVPWEADTLEPAASALRRYLAEARVFLMKRGQQTHDRVWVEKQGRPFKQHSLRLRVAETTLALTGKRIPPHFFRDSAATTLARENSEAAGLIRPLLAHSGFETAERHYIQAQTLEAGREYASIVNAIRQGGRR